jgi:phosphoribosylanthranilate isomerase
VTVSVRIKVCGITHPDDAQAAVDAGADLIGLNFVPGSPRCIDLKTAEAIAKRVGSAVERVAVFRDAGWEQIERVTRRVDLERIQFHGEEPTWRPRSATRERSCCSTTRRRAAAAGSRGTGATRRICCGADTT